MPDDRTLPAPLRLGTAEAGGVYELPVYPFVEPIELHGEKLRHPVAIVGAGLTGLTLACDLAQRGVPAILVDEDDTVGVRGASSRGICYAQKSLECFARLGVYEQVAAKGIQWSVGRTFAGDSEVYSFDLKTQRTHDLSQQPPFINLQQFYLEWYLVDRIYDLGIAELRWKNRVLSIHNRGDHATVEVDTPKGRYTLEAAWVVDCSGARSALREQLGVGCTTHKQVDRWCISDVRFAEQPPTERWTWIEAPFNDNRAVWQHLMGDRVWRLDYQMPPDADPEAISRPDVVTERLRRQFGPGVKFELVWVGPYAYRSQCVDSFRVGRIFFGGDAAHVMSPFGARGGNSGIQDAENLAWKLALVLDGRAPEALLDSYDAERRYAAIDNIRITNRTTRFLSPPTKTERVFRDAVIALAREHAFARAFVNTGRLSSPTFYADSPLNVGAGGGRHVQNNALGVLAHEGPVHDADVVRVMGELGNNVACFTGAEAKLSAATIKRIEARYPARFVRLLRPGSTTGPGVIDRDGQLERQLGAGAKTVSLVRPDLHLAGTLDDPTGAAVERALEKVLAL
jgi:3-(3-hydroxy-phenyl)propionate hydroxylase